jgi:putative membrane protein
MSDPDRIRSTPPRPRVTEVEPATPPPRPAPAPQVFATERSERVLAMPAVAGPIAVREPPPRRARVVPLGLAGIAVFFAGWFAVDAAGWIAAAFERGMMLGIAATATIIAGIGGAGAIIAHELVSLMRLKSVEAIQRKLSGGLAGVLPTEARATISGILAVVPKEREIEAAIEIFQRQVQAHHSAAQQIEVLSRTVMAPLDRRAEAHVHTAVLRAFGVTAISPTALSDAIFFLACGVRMVRGIAASYGHRPTAATTTHLLRRLVLEAGKLGAVDIASATLTQNLGGAIAERVATTAADSLYAAYRMARLGLIVMELCRPIPFGDDEVPSISSLVGNALRRRSAEQRTDPA